MVPLGLLVIDMERNLADGNFGCNPSTRYSSLTA